MVRVLVVDDSAFMRHALSVMLSSDPEITVAGTARDGLEAIAKVKTLRPDIVTLDVEMPRMNGLRALRYIMDENPLPVVMVSSLTTEGARVTLQALEMGAVDFIPKNLSDLSVNILKIEKVLIEKIKYLARRKVIRLPGPGGKPVIAVEGTARRPARSKRVEVVVIGTSTGGPKALQELVPRLPGNLPVPVLIVQHMPESFTQPFAERLNEISAIEVREARDGDLVKAGLALVAPGWGTMRVEKLGREVRARITPEKSTQHLYHPSVDALMASVPEPYDGRVLGVILTGMGDDGLMGARAIKKHGGSVFAQEESGCVVYGMPRAVVEAGLADKVLSLEEMAHEIVGSA